MDFNNLIREAFGSTSDTLISILAATYGEDADKKALISFTNRNAFYEAPTEGIEYFIEEFSQKYELTGDFIASACFVHIQQQEGYFVVNNPELEKEYIFLYKKFPNSLVIHPFEVHETKWKLITPIKVSFDNGDLGIDVLANFTTTPDGEGRNYVLPNAKELSGYAYHNLLLFCFISNQCYAHAEG
ncbi:hypothetical protein [Acinetobacter modestus]|uniref:hypothetical protein n=1 Tax=Acinetobacter modestus TaxID=1776740 RepID=UPI00301A5819